jgi:protein TonB
MEIGPFTESLRVSNAVPASAEEASIAAVEGVTPVRETARSERRRRIREADEAESAPYRRLDPPLASPVDKPKDIEVPPPPQIAMAETKLEKPPIPEKAPEVPKVMASVERPTASPLSAPLKKAFGWFPGIRKRVYVPAKAVRQVQPKVTTPQDTSVAVRVNIDSKGVVKDADLLTKGIDGHLGRSAVEAAKRWRFEPARADDRPVASDMVLRFRFEGTRN